MISFRFTSNALRDENDMKDPRASVLLHKSFDNLPPCLFIVAELDPLRDDSYRMNHRRTIKLYLRTKACVYFRLSRETRKGWN